MPTLLFVHGLRFFFYSNENNEPIHIHVTKGDAAGKIWLDPVIKIAYLYGFTSSEGKMIRETVKENFVIFKRKWHEYFNK